MEVTPKEKGALLIVECLGVFGGDIGDAKKCAIFTAEKIKRELCENLDGEISGIHAIYWGKVIKEIKQL
jgi:hypothetical protein